MMKYIKPAPALLSLLLLLCGCGNAGAAVQTGTMGNATGTETSDGTELSVYCFSAGKADAFLLYTENSAVLIDCGEKGFGKEILSRMAEAGIDSLDYLIVTHFDKDHVGGAAKVLNSVPVGTVLQSNSPKDSSEYEKYRTALENASLTPVTVRETLSFTLDGVEYTVDPPRKDDYDSDDSNNSSLIVSVRNGDDALLFTGDAQNERLEEFIARNRTTYEFLKVPYHGHWQERLEELIASVSPSYAVITSSDQEPEDAETLAVLDEAGAEVFLTREGAVFLRSDGTGIQIKYAEIEGMAA